MNDLCYDRKNVPHYVRSHEKSNKVGKKVNETKKRIMKMK